MHKTVLLSVSFFLYFIKNKKEMETERSRPVTPATFHGLCGTTVSSHQFFVEVLLLSEASKKV